MNWTKSTTAHSTAQVHALRARAAPAPHREAAEHPGPGRGHDQLRVIPDDSSSRSSSSR